MGISYLITHDVKLDWIDTLPFATIYNWIDALPKLKLLNGTCARIIIVISNIESKASEIWCSPEKNFIEMGK